MSERNAYVIVDKSKQTTSESNNNETPSPDVQIDCVDACAQFIHHRVDGKSSDNTWEYSRSYCFLNCLSIVVFLVDLVFDIMLAVEYYGDKHYAYFGLTLAFTTVPSILMNSISLCWYIRAPRTDPGNDSKTVSESDSKTRTSNRTLIVLHVLSCVFQLGPIFRYARVIYYGLKSRSKKHKDLNAVVRAEVSDLCMLRLWEAALEAGPQLVLQMYVLLTQDTQAVVNMLVVMQLGSLATACGSMALAHLQYQRALRYSQFDKENMTKRGSLFYFLWRLFEVAPRIVAFAAFAEILHCWVFAVGGFHFVVMVIWIHVGRINEEPTFDVRCFDCAANFACAVVSVFGFVNIKPGHSRYRSMVYYVVYFAENVAMVTVWFCETKHRIDWFYLPIFCFVIVGFVLCIGCQVIYYMLAHPTNDITLCLEQHNVCEAICYKRGTEVDEKVAIWNENDAQLKKMQGLS